MKLFTHPKKTINALLSLQISGFHVPGHVLVPIRLPLATANDHREMGETSAFLRRPAQDVVKRHVREPR